MRLKVLVDNYTYIDEYYFGEPGLSYYLEDQNEAILFDLGYSDLFLRNARAMEIDLQKVSSIVFSHGHDDHTGGLKYLFEMDWQKKFSIFAHPDTFNEKVFEKLKISAPFSKKEIDKRNYLTLTKNLLKSRKILLFWEKFQNFFLLKIVKLWANKKLVRTGKMIICLMIQPLFIKVKKVFLSSLAVPIRAYAISSSMRRRLQKSSELAV